MKGSRPWAPALAIGHVGLGRVALTFRQVEAGGTASLPTRFIGGTVHAATAGRNIGSFTCAFRQSLTEDLIRHGSILVRAPISAGSIALGMRWLADADFHAEPDRTLTSLAALWVSILDQRVTTFPWLRQLIPIGRRALLCGFHVRDYAPRSV